MTARALQHLDDRGIEYDYIDIEKDPAAAQWVRDQNGGQEKKPTIDLNGRILTEPTNAELDEALAQSSLR